MSKGNNSRFALAVLSAAVLGLVLLCVLQTQARFVIGKLAAPLIWVAMACAGAEWYRRRYPEKDGKAAGELLPGIVLACCMALYLASSAGLQSRFYFLRWLPTSDPVSVLFDSWMARFALFTAILTPVFVVRWRRSWVIPFVILLVCQFRCIHELIDTTQGMPLYNDDHSSFMFRFWVFGKTFPRLVYYNPFWNGGKEAVYIVASGTTCPGTLLWPLWRFGNILNVYTPAIAFLSIVFIPFMVMAATRMMKGSATASICAAIMALGVSRHFFVWFLHFGTIGACLSISFLPLVCACVYRLLWAEKPEPWAAVLLVISAFLFLAWPPSGFIAITLVPGMLFCVSRLSKQRILFFAICAVMIVLVCMPYFLSILSRVDVKAFAEEAGKQQSWIEGLKGGFRTMREQLWQAHPLIVFFGLLGVTVLPRRDIRQFLVPVLACLLILSSWGELLLPAFELSRGGIAMFFLAAIPAGLWASRFLEDGSLRLSPVRAGLTALLLLGGLNVSNMYENRQPEKFRPMSSEILQAAEWIRDNTPEDGRIMFAGSTVHAYGGGHVAVLPALTGREMMACDYYHFSPALVEYNYPPKRYRRDHQKMEEFFHAYNVTHVVTYHGRWVRHLRERPDLFEEVYMWGNNRKKYVFRVKRESSMFLEGAGTVESSINNLHVVVEDPSQPVVLKYNWVDGMKVDPPVEIRPRHVDEDIDLIEIDPNGQREFDLAFRKWF